ncbi:MAG: serine hydrolase [Oscillatoriaceae cyanobacterium Prado104]|jgi:CubicO group peptidase (beta-lactamase class C family)|nr:serine hydrolase [Oscillatoriaceae cyanobacterium Prado104]
MNNLKSQITDYLNAHVAVNNFTGSVLVARSGEVIFSQGCGMANYELDVPNTPQTIFRLASITKQFTALAIVQLQEQGLLDVRDTISKYIPDYPESGKIISIHHLLTHTSGIPNYTSFPDYLETMMLPSPVENTIAKFKDLPLEFQPGEKFSYSNSGYTLLTYILEKVSGKSYETYLQEQIFQPLGMQNSGYDRHNLIIKNRASGYAAGSNGLENAIYIDMSVPSGAGGLYSTVEDLYRWDRALYTEKLVSKSSLEIIFTADKNEYGYGWVIANTFNRKLVWHNGGINGFRTTIMRFIDDGVCAIVLSNSETAPAERICQDLAAIVFGEKYELPQQRVAIEVDSQIYDAYVGEYELTPEFIITITKEDNKLFARATGQDKFEIYPESLTKYFYKIVDAQITFVQDDRGYVSQLILHQWGKETPGKRIK